MEHRNPLGRACDRARGLPGDRVLSLLLCLALNLLVYNGSMALTAGQSAWDLTTALDRMLPVWPAMVLVYVGAFPFWAACYVQMARSEDWYTVMTAEVLSKLLCGLVFVLLPTTNLRPVPGGGVFSRMLAAVYALDRPTNLFPSIHCLESWLCWAGLRGRTGIARTQKGLILAFALLVCLSTLLIRQHVLADAAAGVLLAEGMLRLCRHRSMGARLSRWMGNTA